MCKPLASLQPFAERKLASAHGPSLQAWLTVFSVCLNLQGMVEKWLLQVEQMMLASMQEVIKLGIEAYVQVNENWGTHARVLAHQEKCGGQG